MPAANGAVRRVPPAATAKAPASNSSKASAQVAHLETEPSPNIANGSVALQEQKDAVSPNAAPEPQRVIAQAAPEEQLIVAGNIPLQKPNPIKKIFTAVAAASFDFRSNPTPLRLDIAAPPHALLPEASTLPVTILPGDTESGPRFHEAWTDSKEFHHGVPAPETPRSRVADFMVERRTEPLPSTTIPYIAPEDALPWLAGAAEFTGSLVQLDLLLDTEFHALGQTLDRSEQTSEQVIPLGKMMDCERNVRLHPQPAVTVVVETDALKPLEPSGDVESRIVHPLLDFVPAPEVNAPKPYLVPISVHLPAIPSEKVTPAPFHDGPLVSEWDGSTLSNPTLTLWPVMSIGTLTEPENNQEVAGTIEFAESRPAESELPNAPRPCVDELERLNVAENVKPELALQPEEKPSDAPQTVLTADAALQATSEESVTTEAEKLTTVAAPLVDTVSAQFQGITVGGQERPAGVVATLAPAAVHESPEMDEFDLLRLDLSRKQASRSSKVLKIIGAVAGVLALAGALLFFLHTDSAKQEMAAVSISNPGSEKDWILNFSPDAAHPRNIAVLRSSSGLQDYRIEFDGVTDIGALGWVFRAKDSRNFYVTRIERPKPGSGVSLLLSHYAVVDGVAQPQVQKPVVGVLAADGVYHIRSEAVGSHFTTWIQGSKVDDWTDARIISGGAGLYSESGEHAILKGEFRVIPFVQGK